MIELKKQMQHYIVIDIETTGLYPDQGDRIVEIAAVPIHGSLIEYKKSFTALINPEKPIPPSISTINHITDEMVRNAPSIQQVLPEFLEYIGIYPLIAHNAPFDIGFLNYYLRKFGFKPIQNRVIDTLELSREIFSNERHHNLDAVIRRLGIDTENQQRHRSLGDALLTAQVFLGLLELL